MACVRKKDGEPPHRPLAFLQYPKNPQNPETQMTQPSIDGVISLTEPVLGSFPNLFEAKRVKNPKTGKEVGEPKYSQSFEFPNDSKDLAALKLHAVNVARAMFPGLNIAEEVKAGRFFWPFDSGDKAADKALLGDKKREWSRGRTILNCRSKFEPNLAVLEGGRLVDYSGDRRPMATKFFYTGAEVLAELNAVAYEGVEPSGIPGVTFYVNSVVSLNRGQRLTGGRSPAETFKGVVGLNTAENPLADDVPF